MRFPQPELEWFCDLRVDLSPPMSVGKCAVGEKRIIPIIGGRVSGGLEGDILNVGADWQTVLDATSAELDARYAIQTDDGALIEVHNRGTRHGPPEVIADLAAGKDVDPSLYYMRTTARLSSGDARYYWVNSMLFIGTGARRGASVELSFFTLR